MSEEQAVGEDAVWVRPGLLEDALGDDFRNRHVTCMIMLTALAARSVTDGQTTAVPHEKVRSFLAEVRLDQAEFEASIREIAEVGLLHVSEDGVRFDDELVRFTPPPEGAEVHDAVSGRA